ncbi:MAG: glycosyltransferase, partial [Mesorhizobium sp.]
MAGYGVVIPAFNAAATIADTLRSVAAQTIAADAVVVVDD